MARAYATLANEGRRVDGSLLGDRPRVVERVERVRAGRVEENAPIPTQVLEEGQAELLTDILEDVVQSGTGSAPRFPGARSPARPGRRTTTPTRGSSATRPSSSSPSGSDIPTAPSMMTEFGGEPVTGGTLPAQIWKEFVEKRRGRRRRVVRRRRRTSAASPTWVVKRGGEWPLDNGYCRGARLLVVLLRRGARRPRPTASRTRSPCRSSSG